MDFNLSQEEELFRRSVVEFAERYVKPNWVLIDDGKYPLINVVRRMSEAGLLGVPFNSRYGGQDGSFTMSALATEELAYADPSLATPVFYLLNTAWPFIVQRYGREEVKEEALPRVVKGVGFIGIASTEPQGGSDVASTRLEARRGVGSWSLYGEKNIVTGASLIINDMDYGGFVTIARTAPMETRHRGLTTLLALVKKDGEVLSGFEYGNYDDIGRRGLVTNYIRFNGLTVKESYILGEVNGGFKILMEGFDIARVLIAAASIGATRWLLDQSRDWIKSRIVFNKPIASYQSISFKYAELATRLEQAKLLTYKAAWLTDKYFILNDRSIDILTVATFNAMAKMTAVELAVETALEAMKWFGGASYFKESNIARVLLGALSYYVGAEGTGNIMRLIIARNLIGREVE